MNETPKFTPGPWRSELPEPGFRFSKTGDWLVTSADGLIVAMAIHDAPPEAEPNAHLIAAAPELYREGRASARIMEDVADALGERGLLDLADELRIRARLTREALLKAEGLK